MSTTLFTEALESRTFLSASLSSAFGSAVAADQLQVQVDLLKFRADCLNATATMLVDVAAVRKADPGQATTIVPLIGKLRTDLTAMNTALLSDRLAEAEAVLADESVIAGDRLHILKDKGNATAEAADKAKLKTDFVTVENDMITGLNSRIATRESFYTAIDNDEEAIITAVQSDPNASAPLKADVQKWISDKTTNMATLLADLQKLAADRTQLVADLNASASST